MRVVKHNPKEAFGLLYKVYPFVEEGAEIPGYAFSYSIFDDGRIEIFGRVVNMKVATTYSEGLAKVIELASEVNI